MHWTGEESNLWNGVIGHLGYQKWPFLSITPWQSARTMYSMRYVLGQENEWRICHALDVSWAAGFVPQNAAPCLVLVLSSGWTMVLFCQTLCIVTITCFKTRSIHTKDAGDDQAPICLFHVISSQKELHCREFLLRKRSNNSVFISTNRKIVVFESEDLCLFY